MGPAGGGATLACDRRGVWHDPAVSSAPARATVRIRAARANELEALLALEQRCFTADRLSRRALRRHLASPRSALIVAVRDDTLLGSALVLFRRDSDAARLYSIAVDARARGLGLGARLLAAAEREARRRGARVMRLEVRPDNRAATALYRAAGYEPFARIEHYYEDGAPAGRYRKSLNR